LATLQASKNVANYTTYSKLQAEFSGAKIAKKRKKKKTNHDIKFKIVIF